MNEALASFLAARYEEEDAAAATSPAGVTLRAVLADYRAGAATGRGQGRGAGLLDLAVRMDAALHAHHPEYLAEWAPMLCGSVPAEFGPDRRDERGMAGTEGRR